MTLSTSPVPARSDARTDAPTDAAHGARHGAGGEARPARRAPGLPAARLRALGYALTGGALAWAAGIAVFGPDPQSTVGIWACTTIGALAFQLGLYALLSVSSRTGALGTGRVAWTAVALERVLIAGAVLNTLDAALPFLRGTALHVVFDICWPVSMLGMFAMGVRIAIAGRWRGIARVWPLVAETWALVTVPAHVAFPALDHVVGSVHLAVGYAVLGVIIARRPELVQPLD
jgi:hypothetical protein